MIRNLTAAEWDALQAAATLQGTVWEQDGDAYGRSAVRQQSALIRAMEKVRQIAPE